ncbi:Hypothetical_protein [Hexamita inflata]|uniref:Hypothetical_protein n=1 Tax=Hexamita inflata TaxID=28002 RepID=A0AA86PV22_9EUKA|nr:Hypothetical protein HINF_LOCUS29272 [Hexamita inflata]
MIIYYEGYQNEDFLYTDYQYYRELSQIDNEEFDIQPTVSFVVPGTLLDGSKIILRTLYKGLNETGQMVIKDTGDYVVELPKEFGTRQTELMYLVEIANLIQEQIQAKIDKEYMVIAQTEWLQKHLKARFAISGEQTTIKFPEESYWLAKLLGAKVFKSNNLPNEGNELDSNGLIKTLFNKTMYKTNSDRCITFDYTMYLNLIKTVHVTCKYITKQTVLAKYKQYIILKHTLDITPLARVKITSDFLSSISKDQLYKGIQICFHNEDFHVIPMDENTFYEVELSISKSRKRAQLEIDTKTVTEGEQRRKERQFQDEMFAAQQRAIQEFQLNYEDNKQQFAQNQGISNQYSVESQNNLQLIQQELDQLNNKQKELTPKNEKALKKYLQIQDQYIQNNQTTCTLRSNLYINQQPILIFPSTSKCKLLNNYLNFIDNNNRARSFNTNNYVKWKRVFRNVLWQYWGTKPIQTIQQIKMNFRKQMIKRNTQIIISKALICSLLRKLLCKN